MFKYVVGYAAQGVGRNTIYLVTSDLSLAIRKNKALKKQGFVSSIYTWETKFYLFNR